MVAALGYKELIEAAKGLVESDSISAKRKDKLQGLISGKSMALDPAGANSAGRPANGGGDIAKKLKDVLKPMYPALSEEVQRDHPVFQLDEQTQNMLTQAGKVSTDLMSGKLPDDVVKEISRISASRALAGGLGISQASRNVTARDLGLTSLDLQTKGAELGANLGGMAMDFETKKAAWLTDMRKLDLDSATLRAKSIAMDREYELAKFSALGSAISDYHNKVYNFRQTRGDSQGNIDDATEDYLAFIGDMRAKWRMK